jgi:hypothetical protein
MTTKSLTVGPIALFLVLGFGSHGINGVQGHSPKAVKYEAITIRQNQVQIMFEGHINDATFRKWFKTDYGVTGERVEIPKEATVFGALVLPDGEGFLVMPIYNWGSDKSKYFRCQGFEIGRAPMFSVSDDSEKVFFQKMKAKLESLN